MILEAAPTDWPKVKSIAVEIGGTTIAIEKNVPSVANSVPLATEPIPRCNRKAGIEQAPNRIRPN